MARPGARSRRPHSAPSLMVIVGHRGDEHEQDGGAVDEGPEVATFALGRGFDGLASTIDIAIAIGGLGRQLNSRPGIRAWRRCPRRGPRPRRGLLVPKSSPTVTFERTSNRAAATAQDGPDGAGMRHGFERVCATSTAMAVCVTVEYLAVAQMPRRWSRKLQGTLLRRGYRLPRAWHAVPAYRIGLGRAVRIPLHTRTTPDMAQTMIPRRCPKCQHLVEEAKSTPRILR